MEIEKLNLNLEEMAEAGLHFGHKTSKLHPKMLPFIFGMRNAIHIIDLEKTKEKLKEALNFIYPLILAKKVILVVGTNVQFKELVKEFAQNFGFPYINQRWLGGTFTNFEIIRKRIEDFKELEEKKKRGEFDKFTKKERILIDRKLVELEEKFGGIKNLERLPDAILVLNMKKDELAVKEAMQMGIKIIAIAGTNCNPTLVDFPIPANDEALSSVKYILEKVKETILKAREIK